MGEFQLSFVSVLSAVPSHLKTLQVSSSLGVKSLLNRGVGSFSLVALLGWGGVSWLVQSAIAPQVAQAYTAQVDVAISSQGETYETVLRRAEAIARAAAQRSFDRDILVTDVAVMVLAENEGFVAPILALKVTRPAWRTSPDSRRWATYFPATKSLLGFTDPVPSATTAPAIPPQFPPPGASSPVPQQPQNAPGVIPQNQPAGATPPPNTANPATPQNQTPPPNTANPATPQNQTSPPNTANPATPENQTPPPAGTGSNPAQNPLTPTVPQTPAPGTSP
jgi:hypothetical protein